MGDASCCACPRLDLYAPYSSHMVDVQRLVLCAVALSCSHPHAPATDVICVTFRGLQGLDVSFGDDRHPRGTLAWPSSPFGQLVATAFDPVMPPGDWRIVDHATDPAGLRSLLALWEGDVLERLRRTLQLRSVHLR